MEITVNENEVNEILALVGEIPLKYALPVMQKINSLWNSKIEVKKEKETK